MGSKNSAGVHVILDGFVRDASVFSEERLAEMFRALAERLRMEIILGPVFKTVELDPSKLTGDEFQDEGGITGMCVISTSHMSIHTWELRKCFSLDMFSCKDFDPAEASEFVRSFLGVESAVETIVRRKFPEA